MEVRQRPKQAIVLTDIAIQYSRVRKSRRWPGNVIDACELLCATGRTAELFLGIVEHKHEELATALTCQCCRERGSLEARDLTSRTYSAIAANQAYDALAQQAAPMSMAEAVTLPQSPSERYKSFLKPKRASLLQATLQQPPTSTANL
ncbi:uncharacterized protein LOC113146427 [Cyclospora cayetanensis]|uniref:Uncharacterized protein LOC113146427 n=1 Tax=Cyclospora cayetanensis TaxID=88456 RepID=A0A6P6RR63_9EIME|nr:uncharacterized protein LOC113146427 [Cyclospora cayetanensis]